MIRTVLTAVLAMALAAPALAQEETPSPDAAAAAALPEAAPPAAADEEDAPTERIIIQGRRGGSSLHDFVFDFVTEIGDPPSPDRGYARWQRRVCIGAVNLPEDVAQYVIDRISKNALDLGIRPGGPGCRPNVTIIFAPDARDVAHTLVEERPLLFRPYGGEGGTTQGFQALDQFATSDAPIRWWHVTMVVDRMGMAAIDNPRSLNGPPTIVGANSLITDSVEDAFQSCFVIVDTTKLQGADGAQLADYLSMVTLAQINPNAQPGGYDSILNLFDSSTPVDGLTDWDRSYLRALYEMDGRHFAYRQRGELAQIMARDQLEGDDR